MRPAGARLPGFRVASRQDQVPGDSVLWAGIATVSGTGSRPACFLRGWSCTNTENPGVPWGLGELTVSWPGLQSLEEELPGSL